MRTNREYGKPRLMAYDVRAIANFVLDLAGSDRKSVSNLHINKIIYFLHVDFLVAFSRPLVTAKIEAWTYGPVFREVYREFKKYGDDEIEGRASFLDPATGKRKVVQWSFSPDEERFLTDLVRKYVAVPPNALVSKSHVKDGPWDRAWNHNEAANASMRITDQAIKDWYGRAVKH